MKYIDRKGNITIEENRQDKFLRHLYNDWGGRLCLKIIIQPFVTRLGGWFLNTRLSARMIPGFVERNHIDLSSCTRQEFASYNDFFTRRLKEGQRPVAADDSVLVSPCDGKVTVSRIGSDSRFYIKDTLYTLERLLKNKKLAKRYLGGYAVILRLTVDDYHHYCYVADGEKSPDVKIPGVFHTVNPAANDVCQIYHENTREYCLLKTEQFGTIAMMEVGAMMVGKITNLKPGACEVKKGEEKGYFEFGASYNDFFTRRLKEGQRPVAADDSVLVSPCDGKVTVSRIGSDSRFYIKDTLYTLERLLKNKKLAKRYLGGYAVILRLTVDDYHHYCYVADGEKSPDVKIPGVFHTVNPAANDVCQIYHENTREYCLLKTEQFGTIAMMEVGAMMVGKITNLKPGACEVKKGEEKGYFEFGGSTIVLLLQHGKVRLDSDLIENSENGYETIVRMGERIGKCKLPKRA